MVAEVRKSPPLRKKSDLKIKYKLVYNEYPILRLRRLLETLTKQLQKTTNESTNLENESASQSTTVVKSDEAE
jgi:hypothetical protein